MWLPTTKTLLPPPSFPIQQLVVAPFEWPDVGIIRDVSVYYFQLADAFLTPSRFVCGLLTLLTSLAISNMNLRAFSMAAAHLFACSPALDQPSAVEIGALPAETFTVANLVYHRQIKNCSTKIRDLLPGAWTVLVDTKPEPARPRVHGPQRSFQIAFVRPKTKTISADPTNPTSYRPKDLEVLGLEEFLRATAPDVDIASLDSRLEQVKKFIGKVASEVPTHQGQFSISRQPMLEIKIHMTRHYCQRTLGT
ncbi:hypothetical protein C8A05DRAFT_31954 [Staphylotrichum tortipilum]|uniref:Uncharacterized protein n=1 Tax=Staphylotrichum tortipilum TaxID=2831512 RepID=A0AAN6MPX3_9PEZI|nr:hypothetical protein C8A05DRAFT_31954 [Staphylotrichum longicolle]